MNEFFGQRTYSQNGDDMVLACVFLQLGLQTPSYLDLGAAYPTEVSNTYLFYSRGSRGINVEPNPEILPEFARLRPLDITLNCGVGPARGKMTMDLYEKGHGGTFRTGWANGLGVAATAGRIEVDILTVDDILDTHNRGRFPDLLQIDIEGMDEEVLRSLDFRKRAPMVIDVEAFCKSKEASAIKATLEKSGFFFLMRCGHNCVFVRNDLRPKLF